MIVGSLGNYVFLTSSIYTKTYNSFSRSMSSRWIEHKIIGEKPNVITSIGEDPKGYNAFGVPTKIDLKIELKEYN